MTQSKHLFFTRVHVVCGFALAEGVIFIQDMFFLWQQEQRVSDPSMCWFLKLLLRNDIFHFHSRFIGQTSQIWPSLVVVSWGSIAQEVIENHNVIYHSLLAGKQFHTYTNTYVAFICYLYLEKKIMFWSQVVWWHGSY